MTEARIPTPRRIARTPVIREPSGFSALGDALSVAGQATSEFQARRFATDQRVEEIDHRIALDEQRRQDDALFIEKASEWARIEGEARLRAAQLRQEGSHHDHADRVRQELDARYRAFDESLAGNERVRQRFRLGIVQSAARIEVEEQDWARREGFRAQGKALEDFVTTRRNQLSRADPTAIGQDYAAYVAEGEALIDAGAFNDQQAAEMKRALRSQLAPGLTDGLFNAGQPEAVQGLLDEGFFDGLDLDASKIGDQVAGHRRALDIAARQQQADALAEARAGVDAIEAKIRIGINPTQEEFEAANGALRAAGAPEAELIDFGGLSIQMGLNRQFSEAADPEGIAAARTAETLRAKVAAGTASETEQVAAAHLAEVATARAKAAGARRRELAGQGVQGQLAVLADLDRMAPDQRFIAANEAMEGLGYVAALPQHTRQYALAGREARKARPADFGEKKQIEQAFREQTGDFAAMLGGSYDDLLELSWDIYAGELASKGRAGFDAPVFRSMINVAMGRTRRADGTTQGGIGDIGGRKVVLPSFQNADEFEASLRRLTFDRAVYRDGRPVSRDDILEFYRPEYYRDDANGLPVYRMIDESGRPLLRKGGGIYDFAVPRPAGRR